MEKADLEEYLSEYVATGHTDAEFALIKVFGVPSYDSMLKLKRITFTGTKHYDVCRCPVCVYCFWSGIIKKTNYKIITRINHGAC